MFLGSDVAVFTSKLGPAGSGIRDNFVVIGVKGGDFAVLLTHTDVAIRPEEEVFPSRLRTMGNEGIAYVGVCEITHVLGP
tara:strand:- start:135 stop:374 length:240 start_codon:yes stop_codon:yes gene_type:complete